MPRFFRRSLAVLLLAAPVLAADQGSPDPGRKYFYEDIFTPFFQKNADDGFYHAVRSGATAEPFAVVKSNRTLRVFVLGGSIAGRYMKSFVPGSEDLGAGLQRTLRGRNVEAVGCGMSGIDSYREALILEEVLDYSPDLVVLLSCHNERIDAAPIPLWILHAQDKLSRINAFRSKAAPAPLKLPDDPLKAAAERDRIFEDNLRQMIRKARARGVPILVASPPLDYRDAPSDLQPPEGEPLFWKGWLSYLRRDFRSALAAWGELLERLPDRPDVGRAPLEFWLGRAAEAAGGLAQANAHYRDAMRDDWYGSGRCPAGELASMRRIAAEEGALGADLDEAFQKASAPRLPGLDMFDDTVHWLHVYDGLVTRTLIASLRRDPLWAAQPWDEEALKQPAPARGPVEDAETLATLRYALDEIVHHRPVKPVLHPEAQLSWRAVTYLETVYDRRPEWFRDTANLFHMAQRDSEALGAAWGQQPLKPGAASYWHVGEARLRRGDRKGALRDFDKALALEPRLGGVFVSRALASALAGDLKAAGRSLSDARALVPEQAAALEEALRPR